MTDQPTLQTLRRRLARLRSARRIARWVCGVSVLVTTLAWALGMLFVIDLFFELDVVQRVTVFALAAAVWGWSINRFVRPFFGHHETEGDMALLVERIHGIDTDLIAAIEFTGPEATHWGSQKLRDTVIGDVSQRSERLTVDRGIDKGHPRRKVGTLLLTVVVAATIAALFPQHISTFLRRLALGTDHYPSRTIIGAITVNQQTVMQADDQLTPRSARCPERGPVEFLITCTRAAPTAGELLISPVDGSAQTRIPLVMSDPPTSKDATSKDRNSNGGGDPVSYVAQLPTLFDSIHYQVYLGDAWTNVGTIEMIPLPQIAIGTVISPPAYTGALKSSNPVEGNYRLTVLEGSAVDLEVHGTNGKRLTWVAIDFETAAYTVRKELIDQNGTGIDWQLAGNAFAPLRHMQDTVRFTVHATDADGLHPMRLPAGEIRVQSDLSPDAVAATIHQVILPAARPQIAFQVHDDFGIGRLRLQVQIERGKKELDPTDERPAPAEVHWIELDAFEFPLRRSVLPLTGGHYLPLELWQLVKGDRIKITLEATDFRGTAAGASVMSKPLYLEVSDQAGVMAAILEADQRTLRDLDEMIQRQLGLED